MTITNAERLRLAVNTRQYGSAVERDVMRALCHAALPQPHGLGLITVHTGIPIEARIRVWMPLAIMAEYGNSDIHCGLIKLREAGVLRDKHAGPWWIASIAPLVLPVTNELEVAA